MPEKNCFHFDTIMQMLRAQIPRFKISQQQMLNWDDICHDSTSKMRHCCDIIVKITCNVRKINFEQTDS